MELWEAGYQDYIKGDWGEARDKMSAAAKIIHNDGPSKTLLSESFKIMRMFVS